MIRDEFRDFKPDTEGEMRYEFANLRNAVEGLDQARSRIAKLGHTPTTARERLDILSEALRSLNGSKA